MQNVQPNLFTRPDTFFGICEGLGEDLGFHANILRVALGGLFFFYPVETLAGYAAAGLLVLMTRLLFPKPAQAAQAAAAPPVTEAAAGYAPAADAEARQEAMPLAA